jgi:hypothetical protein
MNIVPASDGGYWVDGIWVGPQTGHFAMQALAANKRIAELEAALRTSYPPPEREDADMSEREQELLIAAKEAAVMLSEFAKASGVSPRGPGFDRLVAAIKAYK